MLNPFLGEPEKRYVDGHGFSFPLRLLLRACHTNTPDPCYVCGKTKGGRSRPSPARWRRRLGIRPSHRENIVGERIGNSSLSLAKRALILSPAIVVALVAAILSRIADAFLPKSDARSSAAVTPNSGVSSYRARQDAGRDAAGT